jgi:hypothetical protein
VARLLSRAAWRRSVPPFSCPSAVAFALDVDRGRVVQQAVEDGRSDDVVGEDGAPVAIALVRGQDDRALLIPFRDELERAGGGEGIERQVAHFVEDEQLGLDQRGHPLLQLVLVSGTLELRHQAAAVLNELRAIPESADRIDAYPCRLPR